MENSEKGGAFIGDVKLHLEPLVERHQSDPEWIVSRMQMYWKFKYQKIWVKEMDFSHDEREASVPTVRFSGSRNWATDCLRSELEDIKPYMDDERGLNLQNSKKDGQSWEWLHTLKQGTLLGALMKRLWNWQPNRPFCFEIPAKNEHKILALKM